MVGASYGLNNSILGYQLTCLLSHPQERVGKVITLVCVTVSVCVFR